MTYFIPYDGRNLPLSIRWNKRAKRLILKKDLKSNQGIVTLPAKVSVEAGLAFAQRNASWLAAQIPPENPDAPAFKTGKTLPFRGETYTLVSTGQPRGSVKIHENELLVPGDPDFLKRRVTDWLKKQAKEEISRQSKQFATELEVEFKRISLKDTTSRWGSCSSSGTLSFNWRLIMAPPEILTYVIAHEVSHLRHMDHSKAFWATVTSLGVNSRLGRHWLRQHGAGLLEIT